MATDTMRKIYNVAREKAHVDAQIQRKFAERSTGVDRHHYRNARDRMTLAMRWIDSRLTYCPVCQCKLAHRLQ